MFLQKSKRKTYEPELLDIEQLINRKKGEANDKVSFMYLKDLDFR